MTEQNLLTLKNITKYFDLHTANSSGRGRMDGFETFARTKRPVLNNINLNLQKGEWVGIVGKNGSGKSTLLKLIAGVHEPDRGTLEIGGSVLPFFGMEEELHPEGRAKDAVLVKAIQIGLPREEALKIYENIVRFSELEDFISQKIKNLSSGMKTRLMLGLMLNINADIYLFDEIPATTDAVFQKKVINRLEKLQSIGKSALIVSHNPDEIRRFCKKAILLHKGEMVAYDYTENVLRMYNTI